MPLQVLLNILAVVETGFSKFLIEKLPQDFKGTLKNFTDTKSQYQYLSVTNNNPNLFVKVKVCHV